MVEKIINWSEVWALLIPLAVILVYRPKGRAAKLIVWYVTIALVLNAIATIMVEYYFSMPDWLKNNNILYNLHSLARVLFFSWYIISVRKHRFTIAWKLLLAVYFIFVLINIIFIRSFLFINTQLFAAESILLILFTLSFFFRSMQDESETNWLKHPAFLVCTGVCLYEAASFFIFLFFYPLFEKNPEFGDLTLSIHNVMYLFLCIMLALSLYKSKSRLPLKTKALKT